MHLDQPLVKPGNGLQEGLLLCKLLNLLRGVASHTESVDNTTEQVDLVRLLGLDEDSL
jgi:hypothetical protein